MNKHFREVKSILFRLRHSQTILLVVVVILISVFYWRGINSVPFHPDETTQIFMSQDLSRLFSNPSILFWEPASPQSLAQHYRLVDPPLTRYLIGLGLWLTHTEPVQQDWNWAWTWEENLAAGALPIQTTLQIARLAIGVFFPFTLLAAFFTAKSLFSASAGWLSIFLTASNALILLHTRRAMAESALLFFTWLTLWALCRSPRRMWLVAIPAALAFNAKYSAIPLVALIALQIFLARDGNTNPQKRLFWEKVRSLLLSAGVFLSITLLLNPFLWKQPVAALQAAIAERAQLSAAQAAGPDYIGDWTSPDFWIQGSAYILSSGFFSPPAVQDVGNYTTALQPAIDAYLTRPEHTFLRNVPGGATALFIFLAGASLIGLRRKQLNTSVLLILVIGIVLEIIVTLALFTVRYQRYCIAWLPYLVLPSSYFLASAIQFVRLKIRSQSP